MSPSSRTVPLSPTSESKTKSSTDSPASGCNGFRFLILALASLCLTSICSNMIAFNVTMLCMYPKADSTNDSSVHIFTDQEQTKRNSILIWAVSIGSILATIPFNLLYARFGARFVMFAAGAMSAISTVLIPLTSDWGMVPFVAVRFVQGISFGANFAGIGMVCSRWAARDENGFFIAGMTIFSQLSVIITNPIAGQLCESPLGWKSVYYFHAAVDPILFGLWIFLYTDYPERHRLVSSQEKKRIMEGKKEEHREIDGFIPYKAICTNRTVLVVWFNAFGDIISAIFLLTYFPTYLTKVLQYDIKTATALSMLPPAAHIPTKLAVGWIFDKTTFTSEVNKMRICNTVALFGSAVFFIAVGFVPNDMAWLSVTFTTINYAFIGANTGGFYKCGALVSCQYAHFVIAQIQFLKCISLFVSPLMVWIFVNDSSSRDEWHIIYCIMAAFLIVGNALFLFAVTDKPAAFTEITKSSAKNAKSLESSSA